MTDGPESGTAWERIDEPVLRWVASLPPTLSTGTIYDFRSVTSEPDSPIEGLAPDEIDRSLRRLTQGGFVAGREDHGLWWRLRLAPLGLVYLGEWPDLDLVATAATMRTVLRALATDAPAAERDAMTRAAGVIGRTADGVLRDTLGGEMNEAGGEGPNLMLTDLAIRGPGLQALGEWPLFAAITSPETLALMLEQLAPEAPTEDESSNLRRAAGYVRGLAPSVIRQAIVAAVEVGLRTAGVPLP